jgi:phosphoadenosine phosphosulfate reductase
MKNHSIVVLEFSGGRDSIAALLSLQPWPDNLHVVHLDTCDAPLEIQQIVKEVAGAFGKNFHLVRSSSYAVRAEFGHPSPIVMSDKPQFTDGVPLMQPQFECCLRTIMMPLHQRVLELGATMIIRGQRDSDSSKNPLEHLSVSEGIVYAYPVHDKIDSEIDVLCGNLRPSFYDYTSDAPDCMTCTGYWGRGYQKWLSKIDPPLAADRKERVSALIASLVPILRTGMLEIE